MIVKKSNKRYRKVKNYSRLKKQSRKQTRKQSRRQSRRQTRKRNTKRGGGPLVKLPKKMKIKMKNLTTDVKNKHNVRGNIIQGQKKKNFGVNRLRRSYEYLAKSDQARMNKNVLNETKKVLIKSRDKNQKLFEGAADYSPEKKIYEERVKDLNKNLKKTEERLLRADDQEKAYKTKSNYQLYKKSRSATRSRLGNPLFGRISSKRLANMNADIRKISPLFGRKSSPLFGRISIKSLVAANAGKEQVRLVRAELKDAAQDLQRAKEQFKKGDINESDLITEKLKFQNKINELKRKKLTEEQGSLEKGSKLFNRKQKVLDKLEDATYKVEMGAKDYFKGFKGLEKYTKEKITRENIENIIDEMNKQIKSATGKEKDDLKGKFTNFVKTTSPVILGKYLEKKEINSKQYLKNVEPIFDNTKGMFTKMELTEPTPEVITASDT